MGAEKIGTLSDWDHVAQSLTIILTTRKGTRVMRRDFGSDIPNIVDRKMTPRNVLLIYVAAAEAIHRWEPRFRMARGSVTKLEPTGVTAIEIFGLYFPRGHLGDYSVAEDASLRVVVGATL